MLDNLKPFFDELEKIAAQKCRSGSTPIRVHNLAKKDVYDGREKTRTKLSGIQLIKDVLGKAPNASKLKVLGLLGTGALGGLTVDQAIKDWSLGRQIRNQQG
jgi:hypothetical protein